MADDATTQRQMNDGIAEVDEIWTSSRTARQIYALGEVEKDISRLLSLAASTMSLLALPQTDDSSSELPKGDERSEQFVMEVTEYFDRLDSIQDAIRSSLAHIRQSRIAPSALNAPPPGFIPPALGVGLPKPTSEQSSNIPEAEGSKSTDHVKLRGLQEERVEREAWRGILDALTRLRDARDSEGQSNGMVIT